MSYDSFRDLYTLHHSFMASKQFFCKAANFVQLACLVLTCTADEAAPESQNDRELLQQKEAVNRSCSPNKIWPYYPPASKPYLYCFYKKDTLQPLSDHRVQVEVLHVEPLVALLHGVFRTAEITKLRNYLESRRFFLPVYTNKFGFAWHSPHFKHVHQLLDGAEDTAKFIYDGIGKFSGIHLPCHGYPTMNTVKYTQGAYLKVHHDAYGSHITNLTWYQSLTQTIRDFVTVFEDCRIMYGHMNRFKCLALRASGHLTSSLYWRFEKYGPPLVSLLLQLSDGNLLGGETFFPNIDLAVPTKSGDVLYFENLDQSGNLESKSAHGACPVLAGEKLIIVGRVPGACNNLESLKRSLFLE